MTSMLLIEACWQKDDVNQSLINTRNEKTLPERVDFIFHIKPILSDRCFKCHGPDEAKVKGNLQLHTEELAFAALGDSLNRYAIVKHDPSTSEIINRIYSSDPDEIMPPPESNLTLSPYEKSLISKWIAQGAQWKKHWAFTLPINQEIPSVQNKEWPINPIDYFILHKIEINNLSPSVKLTPEKLLRKLSFDLRGLPPSMEDIESFQSDPSEKQYQKFIGEYLSSDAHAEKMANEWLDLARYADTHGYQDDLERIMWPWRDWVIHAFKQNMPYDQFVTWQLAGDLLPNPSKEQIIATAFNRNHKITQEGGVIPEEYRVEYVADRTNTFGTAFLGLTLECAKCHDHKYDPISQKEYYQLFSYFNNIDEKGLIEPYGSIPKPYINITKSEIEDILTFIQNEAGVDSIPLMVMKERKEERTSYVLKRGLYDQHGEIVSPQLPSLGSKTNANAADRLALAKWLFGIDNPLTARVTVNRIWQQIFGQGIVASTFDFGNQGALPSHPELLDHLAIKLREENWNIRSLIKYMVSSATYRQGTIANDNLVENDPENKLLARSSRMRLSSEMIRDHALAISGLLVQKIGGPSVKPSQPEGLWLEVAGGGGKTQYVQDEGAKNYRRSLYTFWKRTVPPPNMILFDAPTRDMCTVKRERTSTPLQALVLLNDPQFLEASIALAGKAMKSVPDGKEDNIIQHMFTLATSRNASEKELKVLRELFYVQRETLKNEPNDQDAILSYLKKDLNFDFNTLDLATYAYIGNAIFNLDETIRKV